MVIEELTLEEKLGQLFLIPLEEGKITDRTVEMIQKYKIGGFVLYQENYQTYQEMLEVIAQLKEINKVNRLPLWIAIAQEGSRVNGMPKEIHELKNMQALVSTKDIELVKQSGRIIGETLKKTGVNMYLAPVLDIKRFQGKDAIGNSSYGENAQDVEEYGVAAMRAIQEQGVVSVGKHFQTAIQQGADAMMVSHKIVKAVDKKYPASLSEKVIQEMLREKLKYEGLVITDDLTMLAIRLRYTMKKAVEKAILAGANIVILGHPYEKVKEIIKNVDKKVGRLVIPIGIVNRRVEKTLEMKKKYQLEDEKTEGIEMDRINQEIDKINEACKNSSEKD